MDLASSFIGLGFVLAIIIPIVWSAMAAKSKKKKSLNNFLELAEQHQLKITLSDVWNDTNFIGLDGEAKKLFYLNKQESDEQSVLINLSDIESCKVINIGRTVKTDNGSSKVIDRLELRFTYSNPKIPEKTIEFYHVDRNAAFGGELLLIEKWEHLIKTAIKMKWLAAS